MPALFAEAAPAGGAEVMQVVIATAGVSLVLGALLAVGFARRAGRAAWLDRFEDLSAKLGGLPGWAGIPAAVATVSLVGALFGLIWDESLHIDDGRDAGPLANPSHFFILAGLLGIFASGWLAIALPAKGERPGPAAVRITADWHVPVAGLVLCACSSFALVGFPMDDVSHRLFGQDVTLWGTTHLWMISGAVLCVVGIVMLLVEGRLASRAAGAPPPTGPLAWLGGPRMHRFRLVVACGGVLAAATVFQGEFDYGVPQFRLVFHPLLIAGSAALAFTAARILGGRGAAFGALAFYLVVRSLMTLLVGPVFGEATAHFPLYVAEAALVELAALAMAPRERPLRFGVVVGALVGTIGVAAELGWSQVWMPLPWSADMLPTAIALAVPVAVAAGVVGAFAASAIRLQPDVAGARTTQLAAFAGVVVIAVTFGVLTRTTVPDGRATLTFEPSGSGQVVVTARFEPPEVVDDLDWRHSIAYQGGGPLRIAELREVAPGVLRSAPLPVTGSWKSALRLHDGAMMSSIPVRLPADEAIPVGEIPAQDGVTRELVADRQLLQRERKDDVPSWSEDAATAFVGLGVLGLLLLVGRALVRLARLGAREPARQAA